MSTDVKSFENPIAAVQLDIRRSSSATTAAGDRKVVPLAIATGEVLKKEKDEYQRKWPDTRTKELQKRVADFEKALSPSEKDEFRHLLPWTVKLSFGGRTRVWIQRTLPGFIVSLLANCFPALKMTPRLPEIIFNGACSFLVFVMISIGTAYFVFLSSLSEQFNMTLSSVGCASRECTTENPCSIRDMNAICDPAPIPIQAPPSTYTPNSSLVEISTSPMLRDEEGACIGVTNTLLSGEYVSYPRSQGFLGVVLVYYLWCVYAVARKVWHTETFLVAAHNRRLWSGPLKGSCGATVMGYFDSFSWLVLFVFFIVFGYSYPALYNVYILDSVANNRTTTEIVPPRFAFDKPEFLVCNATTNPLFLEYSYNFTATIGAIFAAAWAFAAGARSLTDVLTDHASWAKTVELLDRSKPEFDELLEYRQKTMCDEEIADYVLSAKLHAIAKFRSRLPPDKKAAGAAPGEESLPHFFDEHA